MNNGFVSVSMREVIVQFSSLLMFSVCFTYLRIYLYVGMLQAFAVFLKYATAVH